MFDFLIVKGEEVKSILNQNYNEIIDVVSKIYLAHENKATINPDTYFLTFPNKPNARITALPAYVGENVDLAGIKWVSSFPDNIQYGIPRASAVLILNDFRTGYPIACMESAIISATRTAASAVLGADMMNNHQHDVDSISFIGNGIISKYIYDFFIGAKWKFKEINLFDINREYSVAFAKYITISSGTKVNIVPSLKEACSNGNIVVLATTASSPYINDMSWFSHNPIILNISLRDLSPEIILGSKNIVDDIDHCLKAATSTHLAYQKTGNSNFISGTIGSLIKSAHNFTEDFNTPFIYSPFGMGILDIALGSYIYKKIMLKNNKLLIKDFFYEKTRW